MFGRSGMVREVVRCERTKEVLREQPALMTWDGVSLLFHMHLRIGDLWVQFSLMYFSDFRYQEND